MAVSHIVAPFKNINGGAWQAIDLYLHLQKFNEVYLWSQCSPNSEFIKYPIDEIKPYQGEFPSGGTLYICGADMQIGHWYDISNFDRIVLIHNLCHQNVFYHAMHRLSLNGERHIEINYPSELVRRHIGLHGEIAYPLPHPDRLPLFDTTIRHQRYNNTFTIGRISRDTKLKHHPHDIPLYKQLSYLGFHIKIIGGTCLKPWLENIPNIRLLPEIPNAEVPAALASFDCFYYRVPRSWNEAFGLVVAEAINAELPVVAYNDGGYVEWLKVQKKSFLFNNNEEALNILNVLKLKHYEP